MSASDPVPRSLRLLVVLVPIGAALLSVGGSYAAVQSALAQKVEKTEFVATVAELRAADAALAAKLDSHTQVGDQTTRQMQADVGDIKRDIRALVCAQRPRPATCGGRE